MQLGDIHWAVRNNRVLLMLTNYSLVPSPASGHQFQSWTTGAFASTILERLDYLSHVSHARSCATFIHRTSKNSTDKYQTHLTGENRMAAASGAGNETKQVKAHCSPCGNSLVH